MNSIIATVCAHGMGALFGCMSIGSASAQQAGANGDLLRQALTAAAQGQCPAAIMTVMLKATCEQQQPRMGQLLSQRGSITGVQFQGTDTTPNGPVEVYRVTFQSGQMVWAVSTGPDGKLFTLWSPG